MPPLLAEDKRRNLRGCDLSGVFMPHVLIVFLPLMQTLSIITFSRDWKLQSLWNKNAAEEWNVYPLHPHYKAYKNQTVRPSTAAFRYRKPVPLACVRAFFTENCDLLKIKLVLLFPTVYCWN